MYAFKQYEIEDVLKTKGGFGVVFKEGCKVFMHALAGTHVVLVFL